MVIKLSVGPVNVGLKPVETFADFVDFVHFSSSLKNKPKPSIPHNALMQLCFVSSEI